MGSSPPNDGFCNRLTETPGVDGAVLQPDFVEFGASGRVWDVRSTIDAAVCRVELVKGSDYTVTHLADDVVLLTYVARTAAGRSLRSLNLDPVQGEWMRFHQGTVIPEP